LLPMLRLVESLAASPASSEIFGATSMFDLLLSDNRDFRGGDSTLCVSYDLAARQFQFRHRTFSGHDDQKSCAESEALQTLRLFLRMSMEFCTSRQPNIVMTRKRTDLCWRTHS